MSGNSGHYKLVSERGNESFSASSGDVDQTALNKRVSMIELFQRLNAPVFRGTETPEEAEQFLRQMEQIFRLLGSTNEEKLLLTEHQLNGDADDW
ncbi:hypothetical protein MLD38_005008 [Melastoma candidum]|uniref:Uncharacterized protein n=1 Tax=Melastoma candidum TaxID=119954 RepID=A0ACB9S933_9MYRT|nr:hypothetical protein MLD38_005008 [Melastoma candidum]